MSLPKEHNEELFSASNELPGFLPDDDSMMVFGRVVFPQFTDKDSQAAIRGKVVGLSHRRFSRV